MIGALLALKKRARALSQPFGNVYIVNNRSKTDNI